MRLKSYLLATLLILFMSTTVQAQNLLKNGDFESGKADWIIEPDSRAVITNESFHAQKAISYQTGGFGQDIDEKIAIVPGQRYLLSGYYKTGGSVEGIWIGIVYMDENWNSVGEFELSLEPSNNSYKPFLQVSTAPPDSRYASFWTWSDAPSGGKTFLDYLSFQQESRNSQNHLPQLVAVSEQQNSIGDTVSLQLHATDADNDTLRFALSGLPDESGITIDTQSGLISGTAAKAGNYNVTVYVTDTHAGVTQQQFLWKIVTDKNDPCNLLANGDFETNLNGWDTYAQYSLHNDAYHGAKALQVKSGGLDQTIMLADKKAQTLQFHGFYKTEGSIEGVWMGIIFYDADDKEISSQEISLPEVSSYQKFVLNATAPKDAVSMQSWIWFEAKDDTGKLFLDNLKVSRSSCYDYVIPSSLPPKGIPVARAPQFVVIGFDDNTKAEGIDWAIDLFANRKNPDGSDARVSFYMNTKGLHEWIEDDPDTLLQAMKRLKNSGHEVANHTYGHHSDIPSDDWDTFVQTVTSLSATQWQNKLQSTTGDLVQLVGLTQDSVTGFRAPYLLYSQNLFEELKRENFLYDCSIEEGAAEKFDGTNFRWPYQLNEGSPGHNENWYGNDQNPHAVSIGSIPGLWELPNHLLMIPKDAECQKYGIQKGLWKRIKKRLPYLDDHKITGFDYNLWSSAQLNKNEVLGILKYNLDLRLQGNRAPFMFGAHTQYYTQEWADAHSKNANYLQMRSAISEFIDYALSKPEVRIVPARDIVRWCTDPVPLAQ